MSEELDIVPVGLRHSLTLRIDERLTVPALASAFAGFADMPPVFATAYMVGFMEGACTEALRSRLAPGQSTVGTHIDVSHVSATPVGLSVVAEVEVVAVVRRKVRFKVACRDDAGRIGEGFHERAIIDRDAFMARVSTKAERNADVRGI